MARSEAKSKSEARRLKIQSEAQQEEALAEGTDLKAEGCCEDCDQELAIMKRSQPSVEIKQDAKGNVSFTVKVYDDDPEEAAKRANDVFAGLVAGYEK